MSRKFVQGFYEMINCQICEKECKSWRSLSRHIQEHHKEHTSQTYFDTFLSTSNPCCLECDKSIVNFRGIREGYVRFCSKKCSCTYNRRSQSQDIEKEKLFRERLGNSVSNTWKEKELDGTAKIIREKISNTCKITNSKLTDEERRDKYGWLHKLSEEERQDFINNVMKKTGYHTWKETVSDEELKDFYDKRGRSIAASKLGLTREEYLLQLDNLPEKEKYYKEVWLMTEQTYRTHWQVIDPERKRGQNYHLDHIYSVITGYFNQIDPDIIASIHNLQILPAEENMKKHHRCQINIDTLMEKYYGT